jgi:hypothetical protein
MTNKIHPAVAVFRASDFLTEEPENWQAEIKAIESVLVQLPSDERYRLFDDQNDPTGEAEDLYTRYTHKTSTSVKFNSDNGYGGAKILFDSAGNLAVLWWVAGCEGASAPGGMILPVHDN